MTHTAAATRTLPLPAAGHQGRRRGSVADDRARPTIAYSDHVNILAGRPT